MGSVKKLDSKDELLLALMKLRLTLLNHHIAQQFEICQSLVTNVLPC